MTEPAAMPVLFVERRLPLTDEITKYSEAGMALLRANLGYYSTEIPTELLTYLQSLMEYAFNEFGEMHIRLVPGETNDDLDQMTYAAWMYRKGVNGEGKTEMLKTIIRNRQVRSALADGVETA